MNSLAEAIGEKPRESEPVKISDHLIMVYDTETTGFVNKSRPQTDPSQPYLVQLCASLIQGDGTERACINLIVKPEGWTIPEQASKIHGITTEIALRVGLPLRVVMAAFCQLRGLAEEAVAHNESYDWEILEIQLARFGVTPTKGWPKRTCTMRGSSEYVNLPPTAKMIKAGFSKNKPPNLTELHTFLFGKGFDGAHNAMADVYACSRSLIELRRRGVM